LPVRLNLVARVTLDLYPDLEIPFHSRWRHFEIATPSSVEQGAGPRNLAFEIIGDPRRAAGAGARLEWVIRAWDLAMVSVL
jgi:hypothetical protein